MARNCFKKAWLPKILDRQLPLNLDMVRKFHKNLGIPAEILVAESPDAEGKTTSRLQV